MACSYVLILLDSNNDFSLVTNDMLSLIISFSTSKPIFLAYAGAYWLDLNAVLMLESSSLFLNPLTTICVASPKISLNRLRLAIKKCEDWSFCLFDNWLNDEKFEITSILTEFESGWFVGTNE